MNAVSSGLDAAKRNENTYSELGRHSTVWFGKRPSFEYHVAIPGTRRARSYRRRQPMPMRPRPKLRGSSEPYVSTARGQIRWMLAAMAESLLRVALVMMEDPLTVEESQGGS